MRRFLYFIPGATQAKARQLADCGLLDRFTGNGCLIQYSTVAVEQGPAGSGCIVAAGEQPPRYTAGQQWLESSKWWTAIDDLPPRPVDLAREVGISGHDITLGDGMPWRVPLLQRWDRERLAHVVNLPMSLKGILVNGEHKYVSEVKPEFTAVAALSARVLASFLAEQAVPIEQSFTDGANLLAVNYRLGPEEAGLLGLFTELTALRVLGLSIDVPTLMESTEAMGLEGVQFTTPLIDEDE